MKSLVSHVLPLLVIDALTPSPIPSSLQDTNDVVMVVTDVFHGEYLGDCIAARIVRGFIDTNALKPLMFLPSKLPLHIKSFDNLVRLINRPDGEQCQNNSCDSEYKCSSFLTGCQFPIDKVLLVEIVSCLVKVILSQLLHHL